MIGRKLIATPFKLSCLLRPSQRQVFGFFKKKTEEKPVEKE